MIGPDFHRPATSVATEWREAGDPLVDTKRQDYRDWWTLFNDPVLTNLIYVARAQNLDELTAGIRVLEARAQLGIAIGELYPQQQQGTASLSYNRIPGSNAFSLIQNTYAGDSFGAQAAWELDMWGRLRRAVQSADAAFLASVADYDDVLVTLTADVASTYVQIRTIQTQIEIAHLNVERQRQALEIALARFHGGVATGSDPDLAENVLGATEAAVPALEIQLEQAKDALCVLIGKPPGAVDRILAGSSEIPTAPDHVAVGIPADLLRRRPDVRKAELTAAAQCAQIGFAKADLLPTLSLTGNVGTVSTNIGNSNLSEVFTPSSLLFSAGPSLVWNILNYGQITNNVRVQDARFQEYIVSYQNSVLKAQQEVDSGLTSFLKSRFEVKFLTQSAAAAADALTIAVLQYREGTADFTVVLIAEQNLYQAQNDLAIAQGAVPLGLIATYRAMGGGWQLREGHDFVSADTAREMSDRTNWGTLLTPSLLHPQVPDVPSPADERSVVRPPEW